MNERKRRLIGSLGGGGTRGSLRDLTISLDSFAVLEGSVESRLFR